MSNTLGAGFLEKVYENAMAYELGQAGFVVQQQQPVKVRYKGVVVGEYIADLLIDQTILLELKAVKALDDAHMAQCMNYLKATSLKICLLSNFGKPKAEIQRICKIYIVVICIHLRSSAFICGRYCVHLRL